jgi:hydrolase
MAVANNYPDIGAFGDYLVAQSRALPELLEVEHLTPRVTRVLGGNPGQVRARSSAPILGRSDFAFFNSFS